MDAAPAQKPDAFELVENPEAGPSGARVKKIPVKKGGVKKTKRTAKQEVDDMIRAAGRRLPTDIQQRILEEVGREREIWLQERLAAQA